jgi:hypothetical protein
MDISKIAHNIKKRKSANDVFYTPSSLVKIHLEKFNDIPEGSIIYEPFYGNGAYYNEMKNKYTNCEILYTEIELGLDFFSFDNKVDYIISNPPYSIIDKVFEKSVSLKPKIISYLIGFGNITTKRLEYMNKNGYFVSDFHLTKVYKWFGMSCIITFSNMINKNIIEFDRIVHK